MTKKLLTEDKGILLKYMREMAKKCGNHRHSLLKLGVDEILFTDYGGGLYGATPRDDYIAPNTMLFAVPPQSKKSNNYESLW
jgi:hypothetical protein